MSFVFAKIGFVRDFTQDHTAKYIFSGFDGTYFQ